MKLHKYPDFPSPFPSPQGNCVVIIMKGRFRRNPAVAGSGSSALECGRLNLAVAKKRSKREMNVLENLYSGTFSLLATLFPSILQKSPQVTSHVTHKTLKNPHWKGLEVHSSPFSMQC